MPAPARKRSATLARPASESKPILAVVLALIGLFLAVAMITHASNDVSWLPPPDTTIKPSSNYCGALGATIAVILLYFLQGQLYLKSIDFYSFQSSL